MNTLKVSDLFQLYGRYFDWIVRIKDQNELIKRLREFPALTEFADEVEEFTGDGIASVTWLEQILERITKKCSEENIRMA
jgi:hypothetical protein